MAGKLKLKTSKSASKRFHVSGKGKVTHRAPNMNHFNAKDDGASRQGKRGQRLLAKANYKDIENLMPYKK
jgi:ribosomal protein L35